MLITLFYLEIFVLVLSSVVVLHEGGHFMVARWCGVKVSEFSIGFGKELWGRVDKHGTRWKLCLIPLGGYVKMLGDEDAASAKSSTNKVPKDQIKYTFMAQKLWKRTLIIAAGPLMNYISAILLLAGIVFVTGEVITPPIVGEIAADSAAEAAGLQSGDRIVSVNGTEVDEYTDIQRAIRLTEFGKKLVLVIDRNAERLTIEAMPKYDEETGMPVLGVRSNPDDRIVNENVGLFEALWKSTVVAYKTTVDTVIYLKQIIFDHRSADGMRGPLGIAEASGDAAAAGFVSLLLFIVNISIAVGFMNLLPIPLLDGGHLMFYAVEAVRGKPLSEKTQNAFLMTGLFLLLALMVYTFSLDVPRLLERILS